MRHRPREGVVVFDCTLLTEAEVTFTDAMRRWPISP
jgi:hypothetical protein